MLLTPVESTQTAVVDIGKCLINIAPKGRLELARGDLNLFRRLFTIVFRSYDGKFSSFFLAKVDIFFLSAMFGDQSTRLGFS